MMQVNNRNTMPAVRLPMRDGEGAVLMQDWTVCVSGKWFIVPHGTETDGASIPRALWRVCGHPLQYPRVYAALLHDWLYGGGGRDECPTRADADAVYRDLLVDLGWGKAKAYIEYAALRIFGGSHWTATTNKPKGEKQMKKMCKILALAAFTMVGACGCQTRVTWEKRPEIVTPIQEVVKVQGKEQVITKAAIASSGGYYVTARSPLWADEALKGMSLSVSGNDIKFDLAEYSRDLSTNAVTMAHNLVTDFALLAEKAVEAYVTAGGSAIAGGAKTALEKAIANYIAKGGNAKNATITFANGNGTITDGIVTEVCTNCAP